MGKDAVEEEFFCRPRSLPSGVLLAEAVSLIDQEMPIMLGGGVEREKKITFKNSLSNYDYYIDFRHVHPACSAIKPRRQLTTANYKTPHLKFLKQCPDGVTLCELG